MNRCSSIVRIQHITKLGVYIYIQHYVQHYIGHLVLLWLKPTNNLWIRLSGWLHQKKSDVWYLLSIMNSRLVGLVLGCEIQCPEPDLLGVEKAWSFSEWFIKVDVFHAEIYCRCSAQSARMVIHSTLSYIIHEDIQPNIHFHHLSIIMDA